MVSTRRKKIRSWPPLPPALPSPVTDNHTHIGSGHLWGDEDTPPLSVAEQISQASEVGVARLVEVGCDLDSALRTLELVGEFESVVGALAIHPNEAPLHAGLREIGPDGLEPWVFDRHEVSLDDAVAQIAQLAASNDRIRAIGETGLDYFRTGERGRVQQLRSFRDHIALAKELDLALQIHDRDAHQDVVEVLLRDGAPSRTVFHCFSGGPDLAEVCAEQGWYVSVAGPITYPANSELREAVESVPLELLLVETDAPFLTPVPHRGQPNSPYVMAWTVRALAELRGVELGRMCELLEANTRRVYGDW